MQGCRCADSEKPKFKIQTLKLKKKFSGHATTEFCHDDQQVLAFFDSVPSNLS